MRILLLVSIMSVSLISCSHLQKFMGSEPSQGEAVGQSAYPSSPRGDGADVIDPYASAGGSSEAVAEMSSSVENVEHDSMQAQAAPSQSFNNEMHEAEATSSPSMEMASAPAMEAAPSEMAAASQTEDMVAGPIETPKIENLDHLAREQNYVMSSPKSSYHKTDKKKSVKKVEKKIAKKDKKSKKSQLLAKEKGKKSKVLAKKSSLKKDKLAKNSKAKKDKLAKKDKKGKSSKVAKKDKKKGRAVATK